SSIYMASSRLHSPKGTRINAGAVDLTGLALSDMLFPQDTTITSGLFVARERSTREFSDLQGHPLRLVDHYDVLVPSADGRAVIVLLPVKHVPAAWAEYVPLPSQKYLRINPDDPNETSPSNYFR